MYSYILCVLSSEHQVIQREEVGLSVPVVSGDKINLKLSSESLSKAKENNKEKEVKESRNLVIVDVIHFYNSQPYAEIHVVSNDTFELTR